MKGRVARVFRGVHAAMFSNGRLRQNGGWLLRIMLLAGALAGGFSVPVRAQSASSSQAGSTATARSAAAATLQEVKRLVIWDSPTHMRDRLRLDTMLTEACRNREFNQRYLMLYKARFAEIYQVGVAWKNPAILVDPNGYATRHQIYYFFHDGGWDGYRRCEVYVQDIDHDFVQE